MVSWRVPVGVLTLIAASASVSPAAIPLPLRWSEPTVVAQTSVAAPPALVPTSDGVHLFWLDRQGNEVVLFSSVVDLTGTTLRPPQPLARGVDSQFGWPVAASVGSRIVLAWMARGTEGVQLMGAVVGTGGELLSPAHPLAPPAEESGSLALALEGDRVHLAWSQFDHGTRNIWYLRMSADGTVEVQPHPVSTGEAPTLAPGAPMRLLWWEPTAFDTHRLMAATLHEGILRHISPLTGPILQPRVSPVIATAKAPDGLDLLIPVVERGLGTRERLSHVRLGTVGPSPRRTLLQSRSMSEVAASSIDGQTVVMWTSPAGRTQHLEVFAAPFRPRTRDLAPVTRVTYTLGGSRRPAIAAMGNTLFAAWLEVHGVNRFRLAFASTQHPRRMRFLLGAPELNVFRPGRLLTFAAVVLLSILPYAAVYTIGFALPALGLSVLASAVFGGSKWWDALQERPVVRFSLFLVVVLLFEITSRTVIPNVPEGRTLFLALLGPAVIGLLLVRGRYLRQTMHFWAVGGIILLVQLLLVLFPWGVRQMSQF